MHDSSFPENGYRDLIDMDSFIKFFMVNIITHNSDFNVLTYDDRIDPGSIFFYKDKNSRIHAGPLWDFDRIFGFNHELKANTYPYPTYPFFRRFFDDPVFLARYKELWNLYYNDINSMKKFIDDTEKTIRKSAVDDLYIWHRDVNFISQVTVMKNYFSSRLTYLNSIYNAAP